MGEGTMYRVILLLALLMPFALPANGAAFCEPLWSGRYSCEENSFDPTEANFKWGKTHYIGNDCTPSYSHPTRVQTYVDVFSSSSNPGNTIGKVDVFQKITGLFIITYETPSLKCGSGGTPV
jgi:hypothetical protein